MKNKIFPSILFILFLGIFVIFFKGLQNSNIYVPKKKIDKNIPYFEAKKFLHGLFIVEDKLSMSQSLETRVPLLDHRVVSFASTLPINMKVRSEGSKVEGKWVLRQLLDRYLPNTLIDRPKSGFGIPLHEWLRGELRDWAEALLHRDRLQREGFFDVNAVRNKWDEHLSGRFNHQYRLWSVLMFQAWYEQQ